MSSIPWRFRARLIGPLVFAAVAAAHASNTGEDVQARIDSDLASGKPIVVHVHVALCDNANQGIVPVSPEELGNGENPRTNLYWGAMYGVRTHLIRAGGWSRVEASQRNDVRILDRVVLHANLPRADRLVPVYVVADAWEGSSIQSALGAYLLMAAGQEAEPVEVTHGSESRTIWAGGASHLLVYVGHNGLMEFAAPRPATQPEKARPRSTVVLACASKSYFLDHLQAVGAHPLLLTTGLMAPEAYTLDSTIKAWVDDGSTAAVVGAAAQAYDQYQKCGLRAARRLFWGAP